MLTWVRLGTIGFTIIQLLGHFDKLNLTHGPGGLLPYGPQSVFSALGGGGIMFAYFGFEQAGQVAGEARKPRDIPWVIIAPVVLATVAYLALQLSFIGAAPAGEPAHGWGSVPTPSSTSSERTPRATARSPSCRTRRSWAPSAPLSPLSGDRAPAGLRPGPKRGLAPAFLARTTRGGVPWAALIATFAGTLVLLLPGATWQQTVGDLTSAILLTYAGTPLCLDAFRRQFPGQPRPYRLPAAWPARALAAFAIASLIVYWCGWETNLRVGVALVVGTGVMLIVRRPPARGNLGAVAWLAVYLAGLGFASPALLVRRRVGHAADVVGHHDHHDLQRDHRPLGAAHSAVGTEHDPPAGQVGDEA